MRDSQGESFCTPPPKDSGPAMFVYHVGKPQGVPLVVASSFNQDTMALASCGVLQRHKP